MQRDAERNSVCIFSENDCNGRIVRSQCKTVFIGERIVRKDDLSGRPCAVIFYGKSTRFACAFTVYHNGILSRRRGAAYFRGRFYIAYNVEIRKGRARTAERSCAYAGSGKVFPDDRYRKFIARIAYARTGDRNACNGGVVIKVQRCGFCFFFAVKINRNRKDASFGRKRDGSGELRCGPGARSDRYRARAYFLPRRVPQFYLRFASDIEIHSLHRY